MQKFELSPTLGISSFSDLENQPGFRQGVKLTEELKHSAQIVEPYRIGPDLIPCGLTCHTQHNKGYLLRLADGTHTNVGKDCGSNHFGASNFDAQAKVIEAHARIEEYKRRVNDLLDHTPEYLRQAHDLWHEAKWLHSALDCFKNLYPEEISQDLRNRSQRSQNIVYFNRELDERERKIAEAAGDHEHFIRERVGMLRGVSIFTVRPRSCLTSVKNRIEELKLKNNAEVSDVILARYAKYDQDIRDELDKARSLLRAGEQFFSEENFKLLLFLCEGEHARALEHLDWDFQTNTGRVLSKGQMKRRKLKQAS